MKIVDMIIEGVCWLCIAVTILITLDVIRAEIVYNRTVAAIPIYGR